MGGLGATLAEELRAVSALEAAAVATAIAYLVLAIRQNTWCWPSACVSAAIYIFLFLDARLYMEAVLNGFYLAMAFYGWFAWLGGGTDSSGEMPVTRWPWPRHAAAISAIALLAAMNGWLLATHTDAAFPYVDSLTTWAAIWTTFLVARKVFENWWYWLAIDSVSIVVYWLRGLELTALLFVLYVAMIPVGIAAWRRSLARTAGARAAAGSP
ncbi:MAG TPA: nicotinamide riboside transporter PnuC [Woeseiaceae bacterium]|nr:nicotinamide riboside transporter PnuC [Woeseiaceae bacterium]